MKVKTGDKFTHPDCDYTIVCGSNKQDGPKGHLFGFFGGERNGKYYPVAFGLRLSKITKKNGYRHFTTAAKSGKV